MAPPQANDRQLVGKNVQLFLCLLGGHASGLLVLSYGVLQVYMYSYLYQHDPEVTMKQMHMHPAIILIVGSTLGWLQGFLTRWVSPRFLHFFNMTVMCGCCLLLFWFCHNFVVVTATMVGIGLSFGMLHVYFITTTVNRFKR